MWHLALLCGFGSICVIMCNRRSLPMLIQTQLFTCVRGYNCGSVNYTSASTSSNHRAAKYLNLTCPVNIHARNRINIHMCKYMCFDSFFRSLLEMLLCLAFECNLLALKWVCNCSFIGSAVRNWGRVPLEFDCSAAYHTA